MKTFRTKIIGLFILFAIISLSSCKKDIETPPFIEPHFTMPAGATLKTIADFKAFAGTGSIVIDSNWYIRGIVVSSDQAGNYFKDIVIQDTTGGIDIQLNKYSLYNDYPLGQVLYINCKGLYLSYYNGTHSLGYEGGLGITEIPEILIKSHVFRDKFPGAVPTPVVLTSITCADKYINTLVVFNYVNFVDAGAVFADPLTVQGGMTPRNFLDTFSTTPIILRSSTYANFKNNLLPAGNGSIRGILTKYNTSWQFMIRDINDVYGFAPDPSLILKESFATSIGSFTQHSVIGAQTWVNDPAFSCMKMSGYANSTYNANEDWLISPALNLTQHTNIKFNFTSAMNYGTAGQGLKVYYSTDYSGTGDPNTATWTELTCTLSPGSWAWTSSGDIDLTAIGGTHTYIAFKYVCGTVSSDVSTWEIKNVLIKGTHL